MPVRWTLRLAEPAPGEVPARHLHALACRLVEGPNTEHTAQVKPFSAAGPCPDGLEINWLADARVPDVAARLARGEGTAALRPHPLRVTSVEREETGYADLAATEPARRVRVRFTTPTYISRAGRQIPLPDPELLLAGLARRWRAFSPVPLDEEAAGELLAEVYVADHRIRTVPAHTGPRQRVGFVGSVVFGVSAKASPATAGMLVALWRFAEYAGAGAQPTHGLGRVRLAESPAPQDRRAARREPGKSARS